jgi:CheY-like chemotaxis protein
MTRFKLSVGEQVSYDIGGSVHIEVIDTGAGMSPEQVSELFQAGVQFNVNVLQAGQGSGLGLYISKGIVEQHGGTLAVSSEGLGRGSTFTCTLPLHRIPTDVEDEGTSRTTRPSDTPAKLKEMLPLRVLVVEDSAMNRKMLVRLLQKRGHSVFEAVDGQEAIDKVEQAMADGSAFDTILMDYEMPVMNGPESSRGIRELGCDSFIVGVTGNLMEEDVNYFKECGANAVLPKPLDFTELENLWAEYGVADEDKMLESQFGEV